MAKVETLVARRNWSCKHADIDKYVCELELNDPDSICPNDCPKMEEVDDRTAKVRTDIYWKRIRQGMGGS